MDWVRRHLDQVTERWSLVALAEIAAPERAFELSARLLGPGRVELHTPHGPLPANGAGGDWPQSLAGLPGRVLTPTADVDLAVLVELGGTREAVSSRVAFVRELVREFHDEPGARIAVLGYRDHFGRYRVDAIGRPEQEAEALVVGCGLSTPAGVFAVLDRAALWRAVPVNDDHAAPSEDALRILADRTFEWRPGVRHVLLTLGRRPPHPSRVSTKGDVMLPCPHRASWETSLARLRDQQAVECLAVLDRMPGSGPAAEYALRAWGQLGSQGAALVGDEAAIPRRLKQAVGHPPERVPRIRLATLAGVAVSPHLERRHSRDRAAG
jgi:hypothetical protein